MHAVRRLPLSAAVLLATIACLGWATVHRSDAIAGVESTAQAGSPADAGGTANLPPDASLLPDGVPATPSSGLRCAEPLPLTLTRFNRPAGQGRCAQLTGVWATAGGSGRQGVVLHGSGSFAGGGQPSVGVSLVAWHVRLQV